MSTIHNPSQFKPEDYQYLITLDNRPPEYIWGQDPAEFKADLEAWRNLWERYTDRIYCRCHHCGNGRIRYVSLCRHKPTGDVVAFGYLCVDRIGFENRAKFEAAMLAKAAQTTKERLARAAQAKQFCIDHPEVGKLVAEVQAGKHASEFMQDIVRKLIQWGSITENQEAAFLAAPARDAQRQLDAEAEAARIAKIPAWSDGIETVTGVILGYKEVKNRFAYGTITRCLIELEDGRKCFGGDSLKFPERGVRFRFKAQFNVSDRDPKFAFYKRPRQVEILEGVAA